MALDSLRQIMGIARNEIKVQTRNAGIWIAAVLVNAFVFIMRKEVFRSTGAGIVEGYPQSLAVLSLLFMMIYASALARGRAEKSEEYIDASDYRGYQMILGQFLGISSIFALLGLELTGLWAVLLHLRSLSPLQWGLLAQAFVVIFIPLMFSTAGLSMLAGTLLRSPLVAYPLLVAYWVCVTLILPTSSPWLGFLDPTAQMWLGSAPASDLVGVFPNERPAQLSSLFAFLVGATELVGLALFYKGWRESRAESQRLLSLRALRVACIATLAVVACLPAGAFVSIWAGRYAGYRESLALAERDLASPIAGISAEQVLTPEVLSYDLTVVLQPDNHALTAQARLDVKLPSREGSERGESASGKWAGFTLHHMFSVQAVRLALPRTAAARGKRIGATTTLSGSGGEADSELGVPIPFHRDGDWLLIDAQKAAAKREDSGHSFTLVVEYSGTVWNWYFAPVAPRLAPLNFVARKATVIRPGTAWYPVAGLDQTAVVLTWDTWNGPRKVAAPAFISHPEAAFRVMVETPGENQVVTGLPLVREEPLVAGGRRFTFESRKANDAFLYAFPWERRLIGGLTCYTREGLAEKTYGASRYVSERLSFYRGLLGQEGYAREDIYLIELPPRLFDMYMYSLGLPGTVWITENILDALRRNTDGSPLGEWAQLILNQEIASLWWPSSHLPGVPVRRVGRNGPDELAEGAYWYTLALGAERFIGPEAYRVSVKHWTDAMQPQGLAPTWDDRTQDSLSRAIRVWVNVSPGGVASAVFAAFHRIREDFGYDAAVRVLRNYCRRSPGSLEDLNAAIADGLGPAVDPSRYTKEIQESLRKRRFPRAREESGSQEKHP